MPSFLERQSNAFKGSLASAASKLSNPSSTKPAASSTLAPASPSAQSATSETTPTAKRKRDVKTTEVWSQPQLTGYGAEVKTQMAFAVDYLKKKGEPKTSDEIIDHLSLHRFTEEHKRELVEGLRGHPRVEWRPDADLTEQTWKTGRYVYRPIITDVKDKTSLLAHLQRKTDASGVSVKDLKDGWPDCEDALAELERVHKVLVVRTKKDNFPRFVWANDSSLHHDVQPEFKSMWARVQLPSVDDMHRKLVSVGQKPTSEDPRKAVQTGPAKKQQKRRAGKRSGKSTNEHMSHLLLNYSDMRK
ncbi:Transcription initiation factor IIE subunit beta-like protein [Hapsidospora chrysogenum ATCC 11550]|uniref:Transcription initiation factor IIE subunit beta n=1 Tax=Hapsidospora chrysogenum (strain ATCC 11550 / CBS 779.69 / DSM 880 / IAM 14645 / JCM 23072 / IMI 49137) TaxID=857340 RepID=A0A086TAG8_HAPC1|nr:Transcription initiation factor IIE subunit beta-like protein [Hapsidospora chrysogenum ATCC 11550]